MAVCWINIWSATPVFLFDPLHSKPRTPLGSWQQGCGATQLDMVLHIGTMLHIGMVLERGTVLPAPRPVRCLPRATRSPAMPSPALCYRNIYLDVRGLPLPLLSRQVKHTRSGELFLFVTCWEISARRNTTWIWQVKKQPDIFWPVLLKGGLPLSWSQLSQ